MVAKIAVNRPNPAIWVRRLVLFRSLEPVDILRDINLRRGLNIIQGLGVGHAVGKSTFCRLIRFCLGEGDFTEAGRRLDIARVFSKGQVGAEVVVQGRLWHVLRPFSHQLESRAAEVQDFSALADVVSGDNRWQEYLSALATATIDSLTQPLSFSDGSNATWPHVLAACTRDQSTRLSDVLAWRAGNSPNKKEDRSALFRVLLGLLDPQETAARREVSRLAALIGHVQSQISRLEQDARVRFLDHWPDLARDRAIEQNPDSAWDGPEIGSEILRTAVNRLREGDQKTMVDLNARIDQAQSQRARAQLTAQDLEAQESQLVEVINTTEAAGLGDRDARKRLLDELSRNIQSGMKCQHLPHQSMPLSECSYFAQRYQNLLADYQSNKPWDEVTLARNALDLESLRSKRIALRVLMDQQNFVRNMAEQQLTILHGEWQTTNRRLERLDDAHRRVTQCFAIRAGTDDEIARLRTALAQYESDLEKAKLSRDEFLDQAKQEVAVVKDLYHHMVQEIAGALYKGKVDLQSAGTISLTMGTDNAEGGETYKALAVPIADFTALLRGISGNGIHPGFLIHDCPREADMNAELYGRLFLAAKAMEDAHSGSEGAAFQYIITTTTPPPPSLAGEPWLRERLSAETADELLFRRRVQSAQQQDFLAPGTEEA